MADDHKPQRSGQDRHEGIAIKVQRERLHQHQNAKTDQRHRGGFARTATEPERPSRCVSCDPFRHLRTAPKVMPRNKWRRSRMVKHRIGMKNIVVAAATAGQSWPPSPMINGMKGGIVCASPLVSRTAKAYSFQAKIKQKIAVAAMPVVACGSTTLKKAWRRVYPSTIAASSYSRGISSMNP